ncbi:MAG: aminopeptidase [Clostridiales bacterium]|nr:aminopeptidase [Clostridiales bacterium]
MADKKEKLFYQQKNAYDLISEEERKACYDYCEGYKEFLDNCKTERIGVKYTVALAENAGFKPYVPGMDFKVGDRLYYNSRGKAVILAVIGTRPLGDGINISAAHIDSPRLDLKSVPLYEDSELAFFKTHYYGGIKKYQWVAIPLELYGTVVLKDGSTVDVSIGAGPDDPQFVITDLLPHLSADQMKKTLTEAFTGEGLNILIASRPDKETEGSDRVKMTVMTILNEKYGIIEEDFLSAEFEAVPAYNARDLGLDRSMIGAYGHDDRSCAYAGLTALMETESPEKTAVCILADKEEIGSEGVTGMKSQGFEWFIGALCEKKGVRLEDCFANSFCLSADVCNAFDPNYPEVSEKRNNAKINYGTALMKFTGSRGKSGSSDASAETIGKLRTLFEKEGVIWQMAELGKVDQGGGGTVAMFMAQRNIETVDSGVPVLSMHAPYEIVSKIDCYMTYKAIKALYNS